MDASLREPVAGHSPPHRAGQGDPCLASPAEFFAVALESVPLRPIADTTPFEAVARATAPFGRRDLGWPLRTGELPLSELNWAKPPFAQGRYLADSKLFGIRGFEIEVIDRPLAVLEPVLTAVYLDLNGLAYRESDLKPGLYMAKHLSMATVLVIARRAGRICGFSLATYLDPDDWPVLLLNATIVDPGSRGKDLTFWLNVFQMARAALLRGFKPYYAVARTQNPLIYGVMVSSGLFYPRPDRPAPGDHRAVGSSVARMLNPDARYDPDLMVQKGAWNKGRGGSNPPRHRRADFNDYCDRHLNYANCDSIIVVGRISVPSLLRLGVRWIWKGRPAWLKRKR